VTGGEKKRRAIELHGSGITPRAPPAALPPTTTPSSAGSSVRPPSGSESPTEASLHTRSRSLCGIASHRLYETPCSLRSGPRATASQRHTAESKSPPACSLGTDVLLLLLLSLGPPHAPSSTFVCNHWLETGSMCMRSSSHVVPLMHAVPIIRNFCCTRGIATPRSEDRMADAPEKWEEVKGARRHGAVKRKKVHTANNHRFIAR
jgi:hypothetical protein